MVCGACGTANAERAKYCQECAAPLTPPSPPAEVRKTVTVLFCDVTGSTELGERLDPEAMRAVMTRYFAAMSRVVEAHGGTVEKFIGDAVMAVFGIPAVHEDDALRALRAALGMTGALDALNVDLEARHKVRLAARIGVNTGEVVVGGDGSRGTVATGDAVNVAARLEQAAAPGQILFGARTHALVHDQVQAAPVPPLVLKGKSEPVPAWRLTSVPGIAATGRTLLLSSPLVGRDRELDALGQSFARCTADRRPHLVTVLGAAGVGKSRLVADFVAGLAGVTVLTGRCLSYGEDIVFWPLEEMLQRAAGLVPGQSAEAGRRRLADLLAGDPDADQVVERLSSVAGLPGTPCDADELQWAVRRLVETLGRRGPVLLVLDDAHWAEPALLDVVEHLADWTRDTPLLLVCVARPELLDDRPTWGGGKLNAATLLLEPLRGADAETLLENLLGDAALAPHTRARILDAAGGMPLFVEQVLAMLADDGLLGDEAPAPASVDVPPSIAALLAARLDRLGSHERSALEAASVIGTAFYRDAVAELVPAGPAEVGSALAALVRKQLVRPDASDLPGEEGFRFLHAMVREAAYAGISKARRSDLHETFARWLDKRGDTHGVDVEEFVGYHLERAVHLRRELGTVDEATGELAAAAVLRLTEHARRIAAADPVSAASLYDRVADLAEPGAPGRLTGLLRAGDAMSLAGDMRAALRRFERLSDEARAAGDLRLAELAELSSISVRGHLDPGWDAAAMLPALEETLARFRERGDDEGLLVAGNAALDVLNELSSWARIAELCDELLLVADRVDDTVLRDALLRSKGAALLYGPATAEELLAHLTDGPPLTSRLWEVGRTFSRAAALALLDRSAEAWSTLEEGERLLDDVTNPVGRATAAFGGNIALTHLGDPQAAERVLRRGIEVMQAMGERTFRSTLAVLLGDLRLDQGDAAEARRWVELGRELTSSTDRLSQAQWRSLLGRLEAADGRLDEAQDLADQAVAVIDTTDDVRARAKMREDRAALHAATGRHDARRADLEVALELYEAKHDRPCARRVRGLLAAAAG